MDPHPRCPHCQGLLKYEPADILGPDRVKCILCGWEKVRQPVPVKSFDRSPIESARTNHFDCPSCGRPDVVKINQHYCIRCYKRIQRGHDPVTNLPFVEPKSAAAEPRPKFGTCPLCQRPDLNLKTVGHCSRCDYRLAKGIDLLLPSQKPGIAAPCQGAEPGTQTAINDNKLSDVIIDNTYASNTEDAMTKKLAVRGTCPICKRDDVTMCATKIEQCFRCYDRARKGYDPVTSLPVNGQNGQFAAAAESVKNLPITDQKSTKTEPITTPAILADDEPEPGSDVQNNVQNNVESMQKNVLQKASNASQRKTKSPPPEPPESVTLQFTNGRDRDLLSRMFSIAGEERRTLENQILIALEDYSSHHQSEAQ